MYCDLWVHADLPFCLGHGVRWKEQRRPEIDDYTAGYEEDSAPGHERVDLRAMAAHLRLEMQHGLQCRHDEAAIRIAPAVVQVVVNFLVASQTVSLLDRDEDAVAAWRGRFRARARWSNGDSGRALLIYAHRKIEQLHLGRGWDVESPPRRLAVAESRHR